MNDGKLGVCIIGCGYMGGIHAEGWRQVPQAEIVAVVDILEDRAQRFAELYGLQGYESDYRQAAARPEVDVVSVCTPTYLHAEMTAFCARLGKHVLCEKPIALNLDQAMQIVAAEKTQSVKLGVGFMRRFSPIMETLRARLASGVIARPVIYYASDIRQIRPKLAMHDAQQNGGPIIDMAVHLIDTWRYIFQSEAVRVSAQGLTLAQGRPELRQIAAQAPDAAIITATFASGDIGSFVVCWGLPPGVNPPGVPEQIHAPNGLAEISWKMKEQSLRWMAEGGEWVTLVESNDDSYQNEIAVMAACILEDKPFPVTPQDGVDALNVALSALESIQSGKEVYLKNATGFTPDANSLAS